MTYLSLKRHEEGVSFDGPAVMAFDLEEETASFGSGSVPRSCLVWQLTADAHPDADLSRRMDISLAENWVMRCDRIDFPPEGVAYAHTHPGPGIRSLLFGELTVTAGGATRTYGPGDPWFESGPEPVLAVASSSEPSAFVRVLVLPIEWAGKRTIRYVNPEDEDRPKLQKATVYLEVAVEEMPGA